MAIPWLIGGAVVAAAAAITAVVVDDSSSGSYERDVRDEERELEKEQKRKETAAKKAELKAYQARVTKNLAQKYRKSEPEPLRKELMSFLSPSGAFKPTMKAKSLLKLIDKFQEQKQTVERLDSELEGIEDAMLLVEALNDEFR